MVRLVLLTLAFISVHSVCLSHNSSGVQQPNNQERLTDLPSDSDENLSRADPIENAGVADFAVLTFILMMFTNAVICGQWALKTDRNFWGWYIFGLFTGPLAGGFMLHRSAGDKAGGENPSGCLAAILGLGIPLAGWIIWLALLK